MKIRTDFVTNSSSSSFVLTLRITLKNGDEMSYSASGYEEASVEFGDEVDFEQLPEEENRPLFLETEESGEVTEEAVEETGETVEEAGGEEDEWDDDWEEYADWEFADNYYYEVVAHLDPEELASCSSVAELLQKLKDGVTCEDRSLLRNSKDFQSKRFVQAVAKIPSMEDIAVISVEATEDYGLDTWTQYFEYDRTTGASQYREEGEEHDDIDGARGGYLW